MSTANFLSIEYEISHVQALALEELCCLLKDGAIQGLSAQSASEFLLLFIEGLADGDSSKAMKLLSAAKGLFERNLV